MSLPALGLLLAVGALLAAVACSSEREPPATDTVTMPATDAVTMTATDAVMVEECEAPEPTTQVADGDLAPELAGITAWLNSDPLTIQGLRGSVVLVDFWTYTCVNCIRTFPYLRDWQAKYGRCRADHPGCTYSGVRVRKECGKCAKRSRRAQHRLAHRPG